MTIDEGYVKYTSDFTPGAPVADETIAELNGWRGVLYKVGLIGHYPDIDVGYGNISMRFGNARHFVISGTQTGHLPETTAEHYALVTDYDIEANRVSATGPVPPSAEAMTHAAIYELNEDINAVVHVHSPTLWQQFKHRLPTTSPDVSYGTPEMAAEFQRLYRESDFSDDGVAVMAGHEEGLISFGTTLEEAAIRILRPA